MTAEWYHLSPVILTDEIFTNYAAAVTNSGTAAQRNAAYLIAEQQMIEALGTPLLPTTITGTMVWPLPYEPLQLPHKRVKSIDRLVVEARDSYCSCDVTEYDGCALIRNNGLGYIDPVITEGAFVSKCGRVQKPYRLIYTYTAGLPTGTAANDLGLHMALAMVARINLMEMVDPGALEGGGGDPGIRSYSALSYSEQRTDQSVKPTVFGHSPQANKALRLVEHLIIRQALRF